MAVGLASQRSILLIMALDTPERSASSAKDHSRLARSILILCAMACVGSVELSALGRLEVTASAVKSQRLLV